MESYPEILEPILIQHDRFEAGELRESLATEPCRKPDSGAALLMRAVLRDAILCLQGQAPDVPRKCRVRTADAARAWVLSRDVKYIFSFESICDVLGLDADRLRDRLMRLMPPTGSTERAAAGSERGDMVRQLRRARMRGNVRTRVVQPRRRRSEMAQPQASVAVA